MPFIALALLATGCSTCCQRQADAPHRFTFALIGDVPYTDLAVTSTFPNMIAEINSERLEFVVHDGDIKNGSSACADETLQARYEQFQQFEHPLIFIPGDNEWTDCARNRTNSFQPEERLERLRELFADGEHSLGRRKLPLVRQSTTAEFSEFRENVYWTLGNVLFAGLNLPGDRNNQGRPEFARRNAANIAWTRHCFAMARERNLSAVMLIIQANPHFDLSPTDRLRLGFNDWLKVLEEETLAFGRPVVLVHGDSHYFRIDKPLVGTKSRRRIENFTRVETFGYPDVHWLHVTVDPEDSNVFTFRQRLVRKNFIDHTRTP